MMPYLMQQNVVVTISIVLQLLKLLLKYQINNLPLFRQVIVVYIRFKRDDQRDYF